MGLLDRIVDMAFRDEKAGRVVVFSGDRRNRGYVVKSESEERKIKSFLKMFYFAHFSILILGMLVVNELSSFFIHVHPFGRASEHFLKVTAVFLVFYSVVVGLPYLWLWGAYKKSFLNFVSAQDAVEVSGMPAGRQQLRAILLLVGLGFLLLAGAIFFLVSAK
jgi:hypothetical protein